MSGADFVEKSPLSSAAKDLECKCGNTSDILRAQDQAATGYPGIMRRQETLFRIR